MYSNLFFVNRYAMRTECLCYFSWLGHWVGLVTFCINFMGKYGNGGWCRDESAYLTPLWLGFHSQTWNHIMLVRILAPRFFFFYLVLLFSSTNKLNTPNAKKSGNTGDSLWLRLILVPIVVFRVFFSLSSQFPISFWSGKQWTKSHLIELLLPNGINFLFSLSGSLKLHLMNLNYMPDLRSNGV